MANRLAHELLGRTLDELPPQTRHVLEGLIQMVQTACAEQSLAVADFHFTRRQAREHLQCSDTQLRLHMNRLVELEYLLVHRGQRGLSFVYELSYVPGLNQSSFLPGLLDPSQLELQSKGTTKTSRGKTPSSRAERPTSRGDTPPESANGKPVSNVAGVRGDFAGPRNLACVSDIEPESENPEPRGENERPGSRKKRLVS